MDEQIEQITSWRGKRVAEMTPEEHEAKKQADRIAQKAKRDRERAKTDAGHKMTLSQTVVKAASADEILKERGLHDVHSRSAHIREVIYWLATQAAEHLGLPGPNYHLLRYGFFATAAAMADPDFVPPATPAEEVGIGFGDYDPDSYPDSEPLVTYFELCCMMEMQAWKDTDSEDKELQNVNAWRARKEMLDAKQAALRAGDAAVDALGVSPQRAQHLREAGRALQELAAKGVDAQQAFLMAAIRAELDALGPEEEARIAALPTDERASMLAELPLVARVMKQFDLSLDD